MTELMLKLAAFLAMVIDHVRRAVWTGCFFRRLARCM